MANDHVDSERPANAAWQAGVRIEPAPLPSERAMRERTAGLPPRAERLVVRAQRWIDRGEFDVAEQTLREALQIAPEHAEVLRLLAVTLHMRGRYAQAIELLRRAAAASPDDALIQNNLGSAFGESGDLESAADAFGRATRAAPDVAAFWFNLGKSCDALLRSDDAEAAYARAIAIDPTHLPARILRANALKTLGRIGDAEEAFRAALAERPDSPEAWAGLIGMKAAPATDADLAALARLDARRDLGAWERSLIGFAYGLALEAHGRYDEAYAAFAAANAARRTVLNWDAAAARTIFDAIADAFAEPAPSAEPALGSEIIFIAGMPRSGSTLTEQILAAHAEVQGAGELDTLPNILREESARRGTDFPAWVGQATAEDWTRLGQLYLERTAHWRRTRARSTDKNLQNWQLVGAIRAMLPGARIVHCVRDPLETCWSTFKHQFANDLPFSYSIDELASYWHDCDRVMTLWEARHPGRIFRQGYEALLADPEARIRALLDFCGLPFDPACLAFHDAKRDVRTASAAQVRAPLQRDTARAERYGALLDPLRAALGTPA